MPRHARVILANVPIHLIQRGHNRQACFFSDKDCDNYLAWLQTHAEEAECTIHAYALMCNHVHLLLSASNPTALAAMMKTQNQRYVRYINKTYRRTGTLWEGRFRSCLTQEDTYFFTCQRYIELNPVRASIVAHPADYRWSSYRANAEGEPSSLVRPHPLYIALGKDDAERQEAYRGLFTDVLRPELVEQIRRATSGNYALGNVQFIEQLNRTLGRAVTPGKRGRRPNP
ncbi:transposase [Rugamonas apoptosis]|uniref:Transposase n=1 Tax=Rugamonas apoptosis TaxID=2758570 RepID=A0A7W2IK27_9BURK|nr:transposase [Rugamonas apoptosis]MBA5687123.1 transposase [Rugamonas apoptosis]